MIVALAGRRIDPLESSLARFPLAKVADVRWRMRSLFIAEHVSCLVCAAACGADLIALEVAGALGLRRRVVLPCAVDRFRSLSVTDRPGNWGPIFDRTIAQVQRDSELVVLDIGTDDNAFVKTNIAILDEAQSLEVVVGATSTIRAVIVWDGESRGEQDVTAAFARAAEERGIDVLEILTT